MDELWLATYSVEPWNDAGKWTTYLERAESILGSRIARLDTHDPAVREVTSLTDSGRYVVEFGATESSRRLFGKLEKSRISFAISHFKTPDPFANALNWFFPGNYFASAANLRRYAELFDLGNAFWSPFYSYGDSVARIRRKKKPSGAVDLRAELPGVFWKTYLNPTYVRSFGKDKFENLPGATWGDGGSVTFTLAETPELVDDRKCEEIIQHLGKQSFVDPEDPRGKQPGKYVVPFSQLKAGSGS
jgi:hypothetical protein